MSTQPVMNQAVLLIADISGYTKFQRLHTISTTHAQQVITELLESVLDAAKPPLQVSKLEGDAVFFFAMDVENALSQSRLAQEVSAQLITLFRAFYKRCSELHARNLCFCDACRNSFTLRMKLIMHIGYVSIHRVNTFKEVLGTDVILIHRLLKNSVPSMEYVLMTAEAYSSIGEFHQLKPEMRKENCEDFGRVDVAVFYPTEDLMGVTEIQERIESPSVFSKLKQLVWIGSNGLLLLTGLKKRRKFHNLAV